MSHEIPDFLFGTAWKKDETEKYTFQAIELGMRGIDTANQKKHYNETGVGAAVSKAISDKIVGRSELFLQTKFTYLAFQDDDEHLPFQKSDSASDQLKSSVDRSLEHLNTDYIDSFLIHGPEQPDGFSDNDKLVWREMEALVEDEKIRYIGVSNFSTSQIEDLISFAEVKPTFVQNRCYPTIEWDRSAREACKKHEIIYQGFNLQRDPLLQEYPFFTELSRKYDLPITTIVYSYARQVGMLPLTGARTSTHLTENLRAVSDLLTSAEIQKIDSVDFLDH